MRDYLVRTLTPILVGVVIALAARLGLEVDAADASIVVAGAVAYGYALAARWLEQRYPAARVLLGLGIARRTARYDTPTR